MLCFFSSLCIFPSPGLPATLLRFEPEQTGVFLLIPLSSPLPATLLRFEPEQTGVFLLISLSFPLPATCWDSNPRRLMCFFSSLCLFLSPPLAGIRTRADWCDSSHLSVFPLPATLHGIQTWAEWCVSFTLIPLVQKKIFENIDYFWPIDIQILKRSKQFVFL